MNLKEIQTEGVNPNTRNIDQLSTIDMVTLVNSEDKKVANAVEVELPNIARAIDVIAGQMGKGGRLIYSGCGTSGRLGVLDASECPPTFSTDPEQVVALMAGGEGAMFVAVEGAEDNFEMGQEDLKKIGFSDKDVLVGIAASGRTPYVLGALAYARECGAPTISLSCCPGSAVTQVADIAIAPMPGPEVVTGSTRLKSGTAQKMVLNMLSTCTMIRLGKVYGNLMVDVKASNAKLIRRCERIVSLATGITEEEAVEYLKQCDYRPKTAIVMIKCGVDAQRAVALLEEFNGRIADVIAAVEA